MVCREIKCKDYLTDDGEPAWCYLAGQPAQVAVVKCPKVVGNIHDNPELVKEAEIGNTSKN